MGTEVSRARARVLMALVDGRALPASVLAAGAGVAASTVSEHLARLCEAKLLTAERHGRARYNHLAGRLGVTLMAALLERGLLTGGDGHHHPELADRDRLSGALGAAFDRPTHWGALPYGMWRGGGR